MSSPYPVIIRDKRELLEFLEVAEAMGAIELTPQTKHRIREEEKQI
jgi:hypothetical protein